MDDNAESTSPVFEVTSRYSVGRRRLSGVLEKVSKAVAYSHTVCITPESLANNRLRPTVGGDPDVVKTALHEAVRRAKRSDTGVVLFIGAGHMLAVIPPFPVEADRVSQGADASTMMAILNRRLIVGLILVRLGRYAVGVLNGDNLLASKAGSRYVKSRHRAGGSSQRRFERSRERLIRELFDVVCEAANDVFGQVNRRLDYLLTGGERHTLDAFVKRCVLMQRHSAITLTRTLDVARPSQAALERIYNEVWMSQVIQLERVQ